MGRSPAFSASLLFSLASIGAAACSSQGSGTAPGDSVLVEGAQHVIWKNLGGGFAPPIPATASCRLEASYDFDLGAGSLAWSVCTVANGDYSDPGAYGTTTGSRVLTADERTQAKDATRAVKVTTGNTCGADKFQLTLEVATASGSIVYGDDFYACENLYQHYVNSSALDQLGQTLHDMAHVP